MMLFHKYTVIKEKHDETAEDIESLTCMFLASKCCNQLIRLNDLVRQFLSTTQPELKGPNKEKILQISEKVCEIEFEILQKIGFDLAFDLPYQYLDSLLNYVLVYLKNPKFLLISTNFLNDSFKIPICLYYPPQVVAMAAVHLTKEMFFVTMPETTEGLKWYELISRNVDYSLVKDVAEIISSSYQKLSIKKVQGLNNYFPLITKGKKSLNSSKLEPFCEFDQSQPSKCSY